MLAILTAFLLVLPHAPTFNNVETGTSTANVSWSQDSTCFEECHFEYMLSLGSRDHPGMQNMPYWIRVNKTQYLFSNLNSGTPYLVKLNAFCTNKYIWSPTISTNFTTVLEHRDEGAYTLHSIRMHIHACIVSDYFCHCLYSLVKAVFSVCMNASIYRDLLLQTSLTLSLVFTAPIYISL